MKIKLMNNYNNMIPFTHGYYRLLDEIDVIVAIVFEKSITGKYYVSFAIQHLGVPQLNGKIYFTYGGRLRDNGKDLLITELIDFNLVKVLVKKNYSFDLDNVTENAILDYLKTQHDPSNWYKLLVYSLINKDKFYSTFDLAITQYKNDFLNDMVPQKIKKLREEYFKSIKSLSINNELNMDYYRSIVDKNKIDYKINASQTNIKTRK